LRGAVAVKGHVSNLGIGISVDFAIHLSVITGAFFFVAAIIILATFAFVFVFAVVVMLLWLFPAIAFAFFSSVVGPRAPFSRPRLCVVFVFHGVRNKAPSCFVHNLCHPVEARMASTLAVGAEERPAVRSLRSLLAVAPPTLLDAAAAIRAWRSHGRHHVCRRSSRVAVVFLSDFGNFVLSTEIRKWNARGRARRHAASQKHGLSF
jgi:hypothetical protein